MTTIECINLINVTGASGRCDRVAEDKRQLEQDYSRLGSVKKVVAYPDYVAWKLSHKIAGAFCD